MQHYPTSPTVEALTAESARSTEFKGVGDMDGWGHVISELVQSALRQPD